MSDYCSRCCYESMFTCNCGERLCYYSHCGQVYEGPWPSHIKENDKYLHRCCRSCGEKYSNDVLLDRREREIYELTIENNKLNSENKILKELLTRHKIEFLNENN